MKRLGVIAGFAVLLVLLVVNTLILRHELSVQVGDQDRVTHTRQVLLAMERTKSLIVDAETGQRGFLYTGDSKYLKTYELAIAQFEPRIDDLAQLTADDPLQQAQIPVLHSLAQTKLAELGQTITLYSLSHRDEAMALVRSNAGLITMNKIRNLVDQMEEEEASLQASRTIALQKSIRVSFICMYLACSLGGLSLILLAYYILLEMNHRQHFLRETQRREEWYRVTLTSIGDAVICTDSQGNITFLNLVAERLTGWSLPDCSPQYARSRRYHSRAFARD